MNGYRLTYWNKRGRGEQVRLFFAELGEFGVQYDDRRITRAELAELQAEGPRELYFGTIPMLEDGEFRLCQAPVILCYLARKHGVEPDDLRLSARADALVLGAEDLRIQYFELFGPDAQTKQHDFVSGAWTARWLPSFDGLLAQNGARSGFYVGSSLTHADIAVWDVLDSILTWVHGASLDHHPRLAEFYAAIGARPAIARYLASDRRPSG